MIQTSAGPRLAAIDLEITDLIADGLTSHQIGVRLGMTEYCVKARLKTLFAEAGVATRAGLVGYAYKTGQLVAEHQDLGTPLPPRQRQVVVLLPLGLTNAQVAERLCLSTWTVKTHLRLACETLGARSRAHAVRIGFNVGLITLRRRQVPRTAAAR
jgi:DNA-binding NarL/FixJ family response regulator